ncbi:rRNA pseudouridine synthase [Candidatus Woesearchaeota archaeon]|nr:rRNA pseudouridine synthase [Candidatus Woesearchaeota archaeon]
MHRVQKLLSNYGFCSRRKAEELIKAGRVRVNSKKITIGDKASEKDNIYVDNKLVAKEKKVYIMFHKPAGCVTALRDEYRKTIMDYIRVKERIFPVGRLDHNASGLLLLTNDGDLANKIAHPRYETKKTYLAKLSRPIKQEISLIEQGVVVLSRKVKARIKKIKPDIVEITVHEGRNKIVKRIFKAVNIRVLSLKRIRIGYLKLGNLKPGEYKFLKKEDIDKIFIRKA